MSQQPASDEDLYARIKLAGDSRAFDLLYERHKLGLFRLIGRYLSDRGEVEDVFQEAFLQVFRAGSLDFTQGSFQGWIYLTARNLCRNRERSVRRGKRAVAALTPRDDASVPASPSAESLLEDRQTRLDLSEAAQGLPEGMAAVLQLRLAGQGHADIARALGIPLGTVKSRFHAILKYLRTEMKE